MMRAHDQKGIRSVAAVGAGDWGSRGAIGQFKGETSWATVKPGSTNFDSLRQELLL
jgi:hypothetical protein